MNRLQSSRSDRMYAALLEITESTAETNVQLLERLKTKYDLEADELGIVISKAMLINSAIVFCRSLGIGLEKSIKLQNELTEVFKHYLPEANQ